ncbi:MAG: glycosyltransferase 87 family protein [Leptospirales bacterium]
MKFRTVIIVGLAIRLAIAPFFAHPFDVYAWYLNGQNFVSGKEPIWSYLLPYGYSFFLFIFPATLLFDFLSKFIPTFTLQMSSLNPILNPGASWNITVIPGIVFDFLVKLVLIVSDTLIAFVLYKLVLKYIGEQRSAVMVSALWFLNPLTIWVSSGWGMFDTLAALFTVVALYLLLENRFELAGVSIALAIAMKYYGAVLIVPLLILTLRNRGKLRAAKTMLYTGLSCLVLFLPYLNGVVSGASHVVEAGSSSQLHYSGLSIWTALTLFYANFNQTLISSLLIIVALTLSYIWIWKQETMQDVIKLSTTAFYLPLVSLLLFYHFVGENLFVWILPFVALLSMKDVWSTRIYWILSLIVFVASVTDSLLPYYMLPMSPWLGGFLVHILNLVSPYRVVPSGNVVEGLSIGKIFLSSLGILSFIILVLETVRFTVHKYPENDIGSVSKT